MLAIDPTVSDVLLWAAVTGIPGLLGLAYRSLVGKLKSIDEKHDEAMKKQDESDATWTREWTGIRNTLERWDVALFGMKGDNGLNGAVKELRTDVDRLMDRRQLKRRAADQ